MRDAPPTRLLDLRGTPCPLNWVKTKLALEEMPAGALLAVLVDEGNPARNVPRSAAADGHRVVAVVPDGDGVRVVIARA